MHEYLHTLEHPCLSLATGKSTVVREGFCEYLTLQVITKLAAMDADGQDMLALQHQIEGADLPSWKHNGTIKDYQAPGDYAGHVERVRQVVALIGDNGVKAAFFQGHLEFLNLYQSGTPMKPLPAGGTWMRAPEEYPLEDLLRVTGCSQAELAVENPQLEKLPPADFLPIEPLSIQGYRTHLVAGAWHDDHPDAAETWEQIAHQNGTTPDVVKKLNPARTGEPPSFRHVLVPEV
ncbi:hypothetical protein [Symbioplanes lichenis]|uniref:hypothetical protein n=1 Tax=Symbioplanes lichenis TaxID=1629072 RepID=UPI00273870E2|nr:hypothetical protein [Actinoplanes lichenis]